MEHREYGWTTAARHSSHDYLEPAVLDALAKRAAPGARVLDIGCGNGHLSSRLASAGYRVTGIDVSADGVAQASATYPGIDFRVMSVYDDAAQLRLGKFDAVIAVEVVEHLFYPKKLFTFAAGVLPRGASIVVTTPYHGYLKNLALSVAGGWDGCGSDPEQVGAFLVARGSRLTRG